MVLTKTKVRPPISNVNYLIWKLLKWPHGLRQHVHDHWLYSCSICYSCLLLGSEKWLATSCQALCLAVECSFATFGGSCGLPFLLSIKDGVVREYFKSRQLTALIEFIEESQWRETSPVPWWRSPTAFQ